MEKLGTYHKAFLSLVKFCCHFVNLELAFEVLTEFLSGFFPLLPQNEFAFQNDPYLLHRAINISTKMHFIMTFSIRTTASIISKEQREKVEKNPV